MSYSRKLIEELKRRKAKGIRVCGYYRIEVDAEEILPAGPFEDLENIRFGDRVPPDRIIGKCVGVDVEVLEIPDVYSKPIGFTVRKNSLTVNCFEELNEEERRRLYEWLRKLNYKTIEFALQENSKT